ncbi:FAS-associated death domain protein isoform X2 [Pseudophryne corroboree]|uniref:FAS-associated death domain protein isoform X2 n=1 Tax=Pseudophryne corroboree TaxID=495146 RepID=UPI0030817BA2
MDRLSVMLLKVSDRLTAKETDDLKFLCRKKITKKKMEAVSKATDLFSRLLEQAEIAQDDLAFLEQLLQNIDRKDLVEEVRNYQSSCSREETAGDQLDLAFDIICDNVGRDWRKLVRTLGVTEVTMEQVIYANPFNMQEQLMQCLKEWRKKKRDDANVSALVLALEHCRMRLVAEKLTDGLNLSHGTA